MQLKAGEARGSHRADERNFKVVRVRWLVQDYW